MTERKRTDPSTSLEEFDKAEKAKLDLFISRILHAQKTGLSQKTTPSDTKQNPNKPKP